MKIIVVGCGRVGRELSLTLSQEGHQVTVVAERPEEFEQLGPRFPGKTVPGVVFDREVLIEAGIERADGLAAVTTSDNANVVTARIAKQIYRVPQVVARLYEPRRAEVYRKLGLQTISSTTWGVGRIMQLLTHSRLDTVYEMGSGEVSLVEIEVGPALAGHIVQQLNVSTEIKVVSITRGGKAFIPSSQMPFMAGDLVHVVVQRTSQARFEALLEGR
ncbi:MAG TPA: TrkA family potassium uptake protein [Aggregatilineales bacterium]|nr:TrkA family potassium uptake protein [Aggregatilineales bacterium]